MGEDGAAAAAGENGPEGSRRGSAPGSCRRRRAVWAAAAAGAGDQLRGPRRRRERARDAHPVGGGRFPALRAESRAPRAAGVGAREGTGERRASHCARDSAGPAAGRRGLAGGTRGAERGKVPRGSEIGGPGSRGGGEQLDPQPNMSISLASMLEKSRLHMASREGAGGSWRPPRVSLAGATPRTPPGQAHPWKSRGESRSRGGKPRERG